MKYPLNMHLFLANPGAFPRCVSLRQVPALLQISTAAEKARAELLRCEHPSAAISSGSVAFCHGTSRGKQGKKWEKTHGFPSEQEKNHGNITES